MGEAGADDHQGGALEGSLSLGWSVEEVYSVPTCMREKAAGSKHMGEGGKKNGQNQGWTDEPKNLTFL